MPPNGVSNMHLRQCRTPLERAQTIVFDQAFSSCGNFLAVSDNFGYISVYRLSSALLPNTKKDDFKPFHSFKASDYCIYSILTHDGSLVCGGNKMISAWSWADIVAKSPKMSWSLKIPSDGAGLAEANSLQISSETDVLYAGCGDGNIHCWRLDSGTLTDKFSGHANVIQCVSLTGNQLLSASEDGTVRVWDNRESRKEAQHVITPSKDENIHRPALGKWLTFVTSQDDMLACGGAPKPSLWSLRTLSSLVSMDTGSETQHSAMFTDDMLVTGGSGNHIYQWYINGENKARVPVTANTVYSIRTNEGNPAKKMLTVAGTGCKVDVCLNFGYSSFSYEL